MEKARNYAQKLRTHLAAKIECHPWLGVTLVEILEGPVEIKCTHNAIEMAHRYDQEHGKEEVKLPEQFKHHEPLFSDEEANAFPPARGEGNHKIELLETAPRSFNCKVYPMSQGEQETEDKFIDKNLAKGYIVPSNSPYGFSTFMVPKKDSKEKRYIIDYRPLNAVTRKDITPLPNLGQCISDLQGMEIFSKFDIRWGYNNIRICEGDEWKGAFKTRQENTMNSSPGPHSPAIMAGLLSSKMSLTQLWSVWCPSSRWGILPSIACPHTMWQFLHLSKLLRFSTLACMHQPDCIGSNGAYILLSLAKVLIWYNISFGPPEKVVIVTFIAYVSGLICIGCWNTQNYLLANAYQTDFLCTLFPV